MERAENLARLLDVNEVFSRDRRGSTNWDSIVRLNSDHERFFAAYGAATPENVVRFYTLDAGNPTSILSAVKAARENARVLRPLISTEMWSQLNVFHNRLLGLGAEDIQPHRLSKLCAWIKESAQAHTGIVEGTFYRDQGWYFYQLGKALERADQTTRILDIKYHALLPSPEDVGSPLDLSQWNALLRSVAGYHAFRRVYPRGMDPAAVAGFLLFNEAFPRSVYVSVRQLAHQLGRLKSTYELRRGSAALELLDEIQSELEGHTIDQVIALGLHEYLDRLQVQLSAVSGEIGRAYFGYAD